MVMRRGVMSVDEVERNSRAAKAVLRAGPLVLGAILLETAVLRGLVLLAAGLATLLALDRGVGAVTEGQRESAPVLSGEERTIRQSRARKRHACRGYRPA